MGKSQQKAIDSSKAVGRVAMESAQAIAQINQKTAQEFAELMQQRVSTLMKTQDPKAVFDDVHTKVLQDAAKEVTHYHQQLLEILRSGNQELSDIAEVMIQDSKADLIHFVNDATNNAPIGSEAYVSVFKTSFNMALQNFDLVRSAMTESFEKFDKTMENMTNLNTAKPSTKKSSE
jgi:phasin family protein